MKTTQLQIELMAPYQLAKDVIFNEAIALLDKFTCRSVKNFCRDPVEQDYLYIINKPDEETHNHLAFYQNGWRYIPPFRGMLFFIEEENAFFIFQDHWHKITLTK